MASIIKAVEGFTGAGNVAHTGLNFVDLGQAMAPDYSGLESAIREAGRLQAQAAKYAADQQLKGLGLQIDATKAAQVKAEALGREGIAKSGEILKPYIDRGNVANKALDTSLGLTPGVDSMSGFGQSAQGKLVGTSFQESPGYAFQQQQGMKALTSSNAARGLLKSGAFTRAAQQYGTGLANQDYYNWLNSAQGALGAYQGQLSGIGVQGQNAAGQQANTNANVLGSVLSGQSIQSGQAISQATGNTYSNLSNITMANGAAQANMQLQLGQLGVQQSMQRSQIGSGIGSIAGGLLGGAVGGPAGAGVGKAFGGLLGSLF